MADASGVTPSPSPSPAAMPQVPDPGHKTAEKVAKVTAGKTIQVGRETYTFTRKGKVKEVYVDSQQIWAIYIPQKDATFSLSKLPGIQSKKTELKKEQETMADIAATVGASDLATCNLAISAEIVETSDGRWALKVPYAKYGDFEGVMNSPNTTFGERISFGENLLNGFKNLHLYGAFGDPKPENCCVYLVDGKKVVGVIDYGKTKELDPDETTLYLGNPRFAPPEGNLSRKGDVWGLGLMLIRNFEEVFGSQGEPLLKIPPDQRDKANIEKTDPKTGQPLRRGIEGYICQSPSFPGIDGGGVDMMKRQAKLRTLSRNEKKLQKDAIDAYIDAVTRELQKPPGSYLTFQEAQDLNKLLKSMMSIDPKDRPTAEAAHAEYKRIFAQQLSQPQSAIVASSSSESVQSTPSITPSSSTGSVQSAASIDSARSAQRAQSSHEPPPADVTQPPP